MRTCATIFSGIAIVALAGAGCGDLDNITTVKDLRVLAVKSDPAGFLVDLDDPGGAQADALRATLTALVVDPQGQSQELKYTAKGCPDYIDTITAATGQGTHLCPGPEATAQFPPPLRDLLATSVIIPSDMPATLAPPWMDPAQPTYEYQPNDVSYGLSPAQVGAFFSPTATGIPAIDQSIAYNRDFGLAAIVNVDFRLGDETASVIKRIVYWPRLPGNQVPNRNPEMESVGLFKRRDPDTGQPIDPTSDDIPMVSIGAKDELYVKPVPQMGAAEPYDLRVRNTQTDQVETRHYDRELLVYQFFATEGTFEPAMRESELNPLFTPPPDGIAHLDSKYVAPKEVRAPDGTVTLWVVVRDERTGTSWKSRTIKVVP